MSDAKLDETAFRSLIERLARAWRVLDNEGGADCFTDDAFYMEPPDVQLFHGRRELASYFSPLAEGTYLEIRGCWFDAGSQSGAIEFSFGVDGGDQADHGMAVVKLRDGLISGWREYQTKGPADFERFTSTEGKVWQWHGGNYP